MHRYYLWIVVWSFAVLFDLFIIIFIKQKPFYFFCLVFHTYVLYWSTRSIIVFTENQELEKQIKNIGNENTEHY